MAAVIGPVPVGGGYPRQLRLAQRAREAHQQERAVAQVSRVVAQRPSDRVIGAVRHWLNSRRGDRPPLPGPAAIVADDAELEETAAGTIARLRFYRFETPSHPDFLFVVEAALPIIEAARTL